MFTSGTQALQGRTVNHDPLAWKWVGNTSGAFSGRCGADVPEYARHAYHGEYAPRPEFAVLDNPILVRFRAEVQLQRDAGWLSVQSVAKLTLSGQYGFGDATDAQCDHAKRVLTRLANWKDN